MSPTSAADAGNASVKAKDITSELLSERFADAFRRHVGLHKPWSVQSLAEATGIETRTLEGYRNGKLPQNEKLFRLLVVLGLPFANEVLGLIGLTARPTDPGPVCDHKVASVAVVMVQKFIEAMEDGQIDHVESRALMPLMRELHATTGKWLAAHDKPLQAV